MDATIKNIVESQKIKSYSCDIAKLRPSVKPRKFHHGPMSINGDDGM